MGSLGQRGNHGSRKVFSWAAGRRLAIDATGVAAEGGASAGMAAGVEAWHLPLELGEGLALQEIKGPSRLRCLTACGICEGLGQVLETHHLGLFVL